MQKKYLIIFLLLLLNSKNLEKNVCNIYTCLILLNFIIFITLLRVNYRYIIIIITT